VPLVRRDDSVLVVVDAQPGFFAYGVIARGILRRSAPAPRPVAVPVAA